MIVNALFEARHAAVERDPEGAELGLVPAGAERRATKRPPLISSIVAAMRASRPGGWNAVQATSGPSCTRSVAAASAGQHVHASHGPRSGRPSPR